MDLLPAEQHSNNIVAAIDQNETVIICGQTGCGKSTIVPRLLLDDDIIPEDKCIAVTQPRRVAAASLAVKVAQQIDSNVGEKVGYKFRFENMTSDQTRLIYLTDGMLLKEYANDKLLKKYACIILDEIHERSVASDILMSCLRQVQIERNESRRKLKLVLMSATMEIEPLKKFFDAPAYYIPGRSYNVEVLYCDKIDLKQNEHVESTIQTVVQLHETEPLSHAFLVFLTGQDEIETVCKAIWQKLNSLKNVRVFPFYAQRQTADFKDIFGIEKGSRKIIVATNIAETSITIPDIRVVIDSGKVKQKTYNHERRFSILEVRPISQAQAIQRAGRAGRCVDGKCYRLYSRASYEQLEKQTTPEILRTSLSEVLFNLFGASITNPKRCKFLDNPTDDEWCSALDELVALELVQPFKDSKRYETSEYLELDNHDKLCLEFALTEMGEKVKRLPLSPMLARFVYLGWKLKCSHEVLTIAAFCSIDDFLIPPESMDARKKEEHDRFMRTFNTPDGDHFRLVHIYRAYKKQGSKNMRASWCEQNGLIFKRLEEMFEVRKQLRNACCDLEILADGEPYSESNQSGLKKALAESFFLNTCYYSMKDNCYRTPKGQEQIYAHPSSILNRQYPTTVIYTELIRTQKLYMRMVTSIERSKQ